MSKTTDRMPAEVREYVEALNAYNRAVCEWLGMDPAEVFRLDEVCGVVRWEAIAPQQPRGQTAPGLYCNGDDPVVYTGETALSWQDTMAMRAEVGEKPRQFTRAQELMLKGLAAEARERRQ